MYGKVCTLIKNILILELFAHWGLICLNINEPGPQIYEPREF